VLDLLDQVVQATDDPALRSAARRGLSAVDRGVIAYSAAVR
jgi:hypothetical protein